LAKLRSGGIDFEDEDLDAEEFEDFEE